MVPHQDLWELLALKDYTENPSNGKVFSCDSSNPNPNPEGLGIHRIILQEQRNSQSDPLETPCVKRVKVGHISK